MRLVDEPLWIRVGSRCGSGLGKPRAPLAPEPEKALETPLLLPKPQEVLDFECLGLGTAFALLAESNPQFGGQMMRPPVGKGAGLPVHLFHRTTLKGL